MGLPHPGLQALYARRPEVIKPGLSRMERAVGHLGPDEILGQATVLIGGTNGKGSTSGFLWQLLAALGFRTGLYTSPHLVHFSERIQISHGRVTDGILVDELQELEARLPHAVWHDLSFFEITTLLAWQVFKKWQTDIDILEVGLGGRWDATNVSRPIFSVITSIGLDHQEFLGTSLQEIAREKAGIMRPGVPVLWDGTTSDAVAGEALREHAEKTGAPFFQAGKAFRVVDTGVEVTLPGRPPVRTNWPEGASTWPPFLRQNFAKALASLVWVLGDARTLAARKRLGLLGDPAALADRAILHLHEQTKPPSLRGRFERLVTTKAGRPSHLLLDVCHNIQGAFEFVRALKYHNLVTTEQKLPGLVSILGDKNYDDILDTLRQVLSPLSLFACGSERTWQKPQLAARHQDLPFYPEFATAFADAEHGSKTRPLVVCGSVYAVGEVLDALGSVF